MAARRVVVFPVRGSRWAWGVTPPPPPDASAAPPPQTLFQIWKRASDEAVENALQGKGILRSAWSTQWNMSVITQHLVDKVRYSSSSSLVFSCTVNLLYFYLLIHLLQCFPHCLYCAMFVTAFGYHGEEVGSSRTNT